MDVPTQPLSPLAPRKPARPVLRSWVLSFGLALALHGGAALALGFAFGAGPTTGGVEDGTLLCSLASEASDAGVGGEESASLPEPEAVEFVELPEDEPSVAESMPPPPRHEEEADEPLFEPQPHLGIATLRTRARRALPTPPVATPSPRPAAAAPPAPAPRRVPVAVGTSSARAGFASTSPVRGRPLQPIAVPRMDASTYPPAALARRIQGTAVVYARVDEHGLVTESALAASSGSEILDRDALERVREYRFLPIDSPRWAQLPIRYVLP